MFVADALQLWVDRGSWEPPLLAAVFAGEKSYYHAPQTSEKVSVANFASMWKSLVVELEGLRCTFPSPFLSPFLCHFPSPLFSAVLSHFPSPCFFSLPFSLLFSLSVVCQGMVGGLQV